MSKLFNIVKTVLSPLTHAKNVSKSSFEKAIKSVKPKPTKGESTKVWGQKLRGKFKKASTYEGVEKVLTSTNKLLQKVKGEKVTKSGFSKGKDLKK